MIKRVSHQLIFIAMWTIKISTSPFNEENSLFGEIMAPLTWYNNWWQTQLELPCWKKLTKLVASWIGGMKCVSHLVPPAALHFIYQASIQPYFDYCSTVWGNCGVTLQDKLQKLQNRAARVLFFSNYDVNAGQLLENPEVEKSWSPAKHTKGHHGIKCLHGLPPDYLG